MKRLFFVLGIACVGCSDKPSNGYAPPPVPVETAEVEVRDVPLYFEAMGIIKAYQTAEVKPQVAGIITQVHFIEGQNVKEGDLLYTIDAASYEIKVQEMQALLAQDRAHLENAKKRLERYRSLSKQDLIAKVEWDDLETKVALYEATVQADLSRVAAAELDLKHCRILAPTSGRAGKTVLQAGNMVADGSLVTISQVDPLYVDFGITEKELERLPQAELSVELFSLGNEDHLARGIVTFLDHTIDSESGMLAARGLLKSADKPLWIGQTVRVHLHFGKKEEAKLVPLKAIKTNQEGPYVFFVKEDLTVEMRSVKLGPEEKGFVVVEEGLDAIERVVTEGHLRLFPGSKIEDVR